MQAPPGWTDGDCPTNVPVSRSSSRKSWCHWRSELNAARAAVRPAFGQRVSTSVKVAFSVTGSVPPETVRVTVIRGRTPAFVTDATQKGEATRTRRPPIRPRRPRRPKLRRRRGRRAGQLGRLRLRALGAAVVEDEAARLCRCPNGLIGHQQRAQPLLELGGTAGGCVDAPVAQARSQLLERGARCPSRRIRPLRGVSLPLPARAPGARVECGLKRLVRIDAFADPQLQRNRIVEGRKIHAVPPK